MHDFDATEFNKMIDQMRQQVFAAEGANDPVAYLAGERIFLSALCMNAHRMASSAAVTAALASAACKKAASMEARIEVLSARVEYLERQLEGKQRGVIAA